MTTPITAAGQALSAALTAPHSIIPDPVRYIIAIETDARSATLAAVRAGVETLTLKEEGFDAHDKWVTTGDVCGHVEGPCGFRAAVLALFDRLEADRMNPHQHGTNARVLLTSDNVDRTVICPHGFTGHNAPPACPQCRIDAVPDPTVRMTYAEWSAAESARWEQQMSKPLSDPAALLGNECAVCGTVCVGWFPLCGDHGRYGGVSLTPSAPLTPERLAFAINDAQIDPAEMSLGRDLRPVAARILAALASLEA